MKKILFSVVVVICINTGLQAQIVERGGRRDTSLPEAPVYNPYQFTNYYQNNSMFTNNSLETHQPANPNAGPYTGNGDYVDPTRHTPSPTYYYNMPNNVPQGGPGTNKATSGN